MALSGKTSSTASSSAAAASAAAVSGLPSRSHLLTAQITGVSRRAAEQRVGDEPVARPHALRAVDDEQGGVGVGELLLDAALHPLGQRVPRPLDAREVDQDHLPAGGLVGRDAADRAPRGLRPVGDDRDLGADERVDQRRLADVGPARRAR